MAMQQETQSTTKRVGSANNMMEDSLICLERIYSKYRKKQPAGQEAEDDRCYRYQYVYPCRVVKARFKF